MTTPISNDKILPSDGTRTSVPEKKTAERSETTGSGAGNPTTASQDTRAVEGSSVDVERANQIYSQEQAPITSEEDSISNPEQARLLATDIGEQIGADGHQALRAQAGSASMNVSALLEMAPT